VLFLWGDENERTDLAWSRDCFSVVSTKQVELRCQQINKGTPRRSLRSLRLIILFISSPLGVGIVPFRGTSRGVVAFAAVRVS
jgi:uncharacterized membrane protein YidH (DUF202 family)